MNRSDKYNFYLPQNTDPIDVNDFNNNFGIIDENLITQPQTFTDTQKSNARTNIGAASASDLGSKSSASSVTGDDAFSKINALNGKIDNLGFEIPQGAWTDVINNYSVLIAVAKGTVGGNKVALSIMIPTAALEDTARLWVVTDAYNNTSAIHFQVSASKTTYMAGFNYGSGTVSDASYSWYGF